MQAPESHFKVKCQNFHFVSKSEARSVVHGQGLGQLLALQKTPVTDECLTTVQNFIQNIMKTGISQ